MQIQNDLPEILKLISIQSPFIIPLVIIFASFIKAEGETGADSYFKILFYVLGGLVLAMSWVFLATMVGIKISPEDVKKKSSVCSTFSIFSTPFFIVPAWNIYFLSYTFFYLLIPMIKNHQPRIFAMLIFGFFILLDSFLRWRVFNCYGTDFGTGLCAILVGGIAGGLFAFVWFAIINSINNGNFVFFSEKDGNKVVCSKKNRREKICTVN